MSDRLDRVLQRAPVPSTTKMVLRPTNNLLPEISFLFSFIRLLNNYKAIGLLPGYIDRLHVYKETLALVSMQVNRVVANVIIILLYYVSE